MKHFASYTILAPGFAKWFGSDARALSQVLKSQGHSLIEIDEEDYLPWRPQGTAAKILRRLSRRFLSAEYSRAVLERAENAAFDFVLSYKGNLLTPETVSRLREFGKPLYNFYPDVSFVDHTPNIPAALKLYDCVFTTKCFHGERERVRFGIRNLKHVRHGFDPEVHRPLHASEDVTARYACDISFVGCWSPEKESALTFLLKAAPDLDVRVYGLGWNHASASFRKLLGTGLKPGVFGDELALVYGASRINLGLLSCSSSDATLRDQTTARTFQVPAAGGFMLHEDTREVRSLFTDGKEMMLFGSNEEMVAQIRLALDSPGLREAIRRAGHERCWREPYDYQGAAKDIVGYFEAASNRSVSRPERKFVAIT